MIRTASKRYWTSVAEMRGAQVALHPHLITDMHGVVAVTVKVGDGALTDIPVPISVPVVIAILMVALSKSE